MPRKKNPVKKDVFSDIIKNFESFCSLTKYNRLQHDYKDIIRRRYTGMYDRKNEDIRRQLPEEKYKLLKTNDEYRNRRISAFVNVAADISPKFESKYPDICIEDELAYYCAALVHETPEWLGKNWYMTVAVALFILDSIVQSGQYYQAVYFIPRNNKTRHVDLPVSFRDSMFETDVIKGVMYLIINRHNSDEVYYSPETVSIKPDETRFHSYLEHRITCEHMNHKEEVLLKYRKAEEMSLSERYYALISFIKPEILERAAETYRKQCYEVADIVLEEANNSRKEFTELCSSAKKIIEEIKKTNKIMDSCKKEAASGVKKIHDTPKIKSIMANPDSPPADFFDPVHGTYTMMNYLKTREKRRKLSDELQKKILELYDKDYALLKNYDTINSGFIENIRYSENKRVTGFKNENPYESVFGFLYLLDCGDDIAWIPAFFECVCGYAVQRMPWVTSMCYDLRKMTYEKDGVENFEDEEWYEKGYALKYDDTYMWKREDFEPAFSET